MMTLDARLDLILAAAGTLEPFTGALTRELMREVYEREAGFETARRPRSIVHILSGNTPHSAYQSLLNGVLLGAHNRMKLPAEALLDFAIPASLAQFAEVARTLPPDWIPEAEAVVVYGSDGTIRHFREMCPLEIPFVGHGERLGIAMIGEPSPEAAALAAGDVGRFNQSGCLSLQTIFLEDPRGFGPLLAEAMADFEKGHPRGELSLSEAGAITNLREEIRYLKAQEPDRYELWESADSTAWTIVYEDDPALALSPGNRTIFLRPLPADFAQMSHLSGIGLYPFEDRRDLPSPRIFPLGEAQDPPALWAHDGLAPLGALVRQQTRG